MNKVNMKDIIEQSFSQYAGAVLQSRALVDVRDCLKPSARQIFYCLLTDDFLPNKPFKKTLKAIGSVARLYIHGDSSATGIIMRAGQPFAMRYPLVEVEGNDGNLMKSGNWAAPRYTSSRLSPFAVKLFEDVSKDTIKDWRDNYDDTEKYPSVLPSKGFYNIVNGSLGVGIGAASSIPQFNIKDVNKALETLLLNPNASFEEIYCCPDFATGAYLINESEVKEALKNGTGSSCRLRAKMEWDNKDNCFIATEIPYGVYTETICNELEAILRDESNPGIDRFNDLTGSTPCIKIYLGNKVNKEKVLSYLYKNTSLQSYFGINLTMLDNGRFPKVFTWKEALSAHVAHEVEVYRRGFNYDLGKLRSKIHILEGLLKCLASIDEVIEIIKTSPSPSEASLNLQKNFILDEAQAKAVLNITLSRLPKLEVEKTQKQKEALEEKAKAIEEILNNKDLFNNELIKEWRNLAAKYGDDRRTQVISVVEEEDSKNTLPPAEETTVIISKDNRIWRKTSSKVAVQRRNGRGVKNDTAIMSSFVTTTADILLLFSNKGQMYKLPVHLIDEQETSLNRLLELGDDEKIIAAASADNSKDKQYIMFFTKQGMLKKSEISEYTKTKRGKSVAAIKLKDGDSIANVIFINEEPIIIATVKGMAIKFETKDITPIGRFTSGIKAIKLDEGDTVIKGIEATDEILIVTKNGYGKRIKVTEELPLKNRGTKNVLLLPITSNTGEVVDIASTQRKDVVMISGNPFSISCKIEEISVQSRVGSGVSLIKNSLITSISVL